jgi:hypothetical protein
MAQQILMKLWTEQIFLYANLVMFYTTYMSFIQIRLAIHSYHCF